MFTFKTPAETKCSLIILKGEGLGAIPGLQGGSRGGAHKHKRNVTPYEANIFKSAKDGHAFLGLGGFLVWDSSPT